MSPRVLGLDRRDLLIVIGAFAVSRLLYGMLGVHFDASTFPRYMQFIDADLLKNHLFESLWYYHASPPLLNLFVGLGLKIFGPLADVFFSVSFHSLGLLIALSVYTLTQKLSASRVAPCVVTVLLVFSPAFVLYENWLMYTFPSVALLTLSALALHRYVQTRKTSWCIAFFSLLAVLLLTRSLFHIAWLVVIVVLLTVMLWERRRQVLMAAALPLLVVVCWYGKNYFLFGTFSGSTMLGIGMSNITTLVVPRADLQRLVDAGELSPFALISRYEQTYVLFSSQPYLPPSGVPVLDQVKKADGTYNYNNAQMVAMNRVYTHDAFTVIRKFPASYVIGLTIANRLFFSPPSMNIYFSKQNLLAVRPLELVFNPLLYGARPTHGYFSQPHFGLPSQYQLEVNTSIPLVVMWFVVIVYAYVEARREVLADRRNVSARALVMGFFVVTAVYLHVVGTAFELAENYRYRYMIEPLFLVMTTVAVTDLLRALRARFGKNAAAAAVTRSPVS